MKQCCFIVPYFGRFPDSFKLFLKTCSHNRDFNWLIITDDERHFDYPPNVKLVYVSFEKLKSIVSSKFDFNVALDNPYKLCDFKPAYGYIFEEFITDFAFWGHCDIDIVLGDLSFFLNELFKENYDKMFCLGHMIIYKNNTENNRLFMTEYSGELLYKKVFSTSEICWFDEVYKDDRNINNIFLTLNRKVFQEDYSINFKVLPTEFIRTIYCPGSAEEKGHYIDEEGINALYFWDQGHIYRVYEKDNQLHKEEFMYIHLQKRKMQLDKKVLSERSFKIVPNRFLVLEHLPINIMTYKTIKKSYLCVHSSRIKLSQKIKGLKKKFIKT